MDVAYKIGSSRIPVLLHGTSLEAALELLREGITRPPENAPWRHDNVGYMFFHPLKPGFKGHPLYDSLNDRNIAQVRLDARDYAQLNQYERFMNDNSIPMPSSFHGFDYHEVDAWMMGNMSDDELRNVLGNQVDTDGLFGKYDWQKVRRRLARRKGVVIELNKKAFELDIDEVLDEAGEITIYLPDGLDMEYVHQIMPCGRFEERAIDRFAKRHPERKIRKVVINI